MVLSAVALFRERGIAGTALSEVVEHSGAPRGSIYHYFPEGKAQLAAEATELAGRVMRTLIARATDTHGPTGAVRAIVAGTRQRLLDSDFDSGCPIAAGALEGGFAPEARDVAGAAFGSWEDALAGALREHGVRSDRADALATTIVCAVEGAIIVAKAQRSVRALDRVEERLLEDLALLRLGDQ